MQNISWGASSCRSDISVNSEKTGKNSNWKEFKIPDKKLMSLKLILKIYILIVCHNAPLVIQES